MNLQTYGDALAQAVTIGGITALDGTEIDIRSTRHEGDLWVCRHCWAVGKQRSDGAQTHAADHHGGVSA